MNWRRRLAGQNRRVSSVVVALVLGAAVGLRVLNRFVGPDQFPRALFDHIPLVGFLGVVLPLLAAVIHAFWNDGWVVSVSVVYAGLLAIPPAPFSLYTYSPLVDTILDPLPLSVVWGSGCYLAGIVLWLGVIHVARRSRPQA
jgi:hypothetical protein